MDPVDEALNHAQRLLHTAENDASRIGATEADFTRSEQLGTLAESWINIAHIQFNRQCSDSDGIM